MIVPDSIEPIVGWKGLGISDGMLHSLHNGQKWEYGEPFAAECKITPTPTVRWKALSWLEGELPENYQPPPMLYTGPAVAMSSYAMTPITYQEPVSESPPGIELPATYHWRRVVEYPEQHPAPFEHCSCGIYIAQDTTEPKHYGSVMIEVYGWGKVVEHSLGYRCQFAYPKKIHIDERQYDERLEKYGVEIEVHKKNTQITPPPIKRKKPRPDVWMMVGGVVVTLANILILAARSFS